MIAIEQNIGRYLDAKGRLSAVKIAGFHFLTNTEGYQVKYCEEENLDLMARDPSYGGSVEKPLSYAELAVYRRKFLEEYAAQKKDGVGLKSG